MQDFYLSFSDEAAARAVLYRTENGNELPNFINIDTIGVIHKPTGETQTLEDGLVVPVTTAVPGWHVNVRLLDTEDGSTLEPFKVNPATPVRVWA